MIPRAKVPMLESQVVKQIMAGLRADGWLVLRNNTGAMRAAYKGKARFMRFGSPGSADILAWRKGYPPLAVECKRPLGVATDVQRQWLADFAQHGGLAVVVSDYSQVTARINDWLTCPPALRQEEFPNG